MIFLDNSASPPLQEGLAGTEVAPTLVTEFSDDMDPEDAVATIPAPGRRERSKQEKLDRITAAASAMFAERGVDDVTTQQIAERADVGAGTLFLYAKTKGELLLLVQNLHYAEALARGQANAASIADTLDAVQAIVHPIVECNRAQIDNGRTYLREMVFGDPEEPRHAEALAIAAQTGRAIAEVLGRNGRISEAEATTLARIASSAMFLSMATAAKSASVDDIVEDIRDQIQALVPL